MRPTRRRRLTILECRVADDTGPLKAVWFNQAYLADQLVAGHAAAAARKARGRPRRRDLPGVRARARARAGGDGSGRHTTGLVPVYPATEGLSARRIRELAWHASAALERHAPEPLPARGCAPARAWPGKADAIAAAHWPESLEEVPVARRRLAFEELFLFQLALVMRRRTRSETREAELLGAPGHARARLARTRCRSSPPPASARRSRRSTPT